MGDSLNVCVSVFVRLYLLWWCLHLDPLLLAELRQRFLDSQGGESGGTVGIPTLPHYLGHHPQGLQRRETHG